jgi:lysophospholipase L1-like esterase
VPVYPACRWDIGTEAFVAVLVAPGVPLDEVPTHAPRTKRASADGFGLGPGAYFGINRLLYFADARASYWVAYQKVADYVSIADAQLGELARNILAKPLPADAGPAAAPPPVLGVSLGAPAPEAPGRRRPLKVFFAGDSMAAGPSWGLYEATRDLPAIRLSAEYQVGSGLTRHDYFDWYRHLAAIAAGLGPDLIIWQSGANDRQPIRVEGELAHLDTPAWEAEYRRRIQATMRALSAAGRKLVWVGLPPMEDAEADAFARQVNAMAAAAAAAFPGVAYLDAYRLFAGPDGGYAFELPLDGAPQAVRTPDGLHLNMAGSRLLAGRILTSLAELTGLPITAGPAAGDTPALPRDAAQRQ